MSCRFMNPLKLNSNTEDSVEVLPLPVDLCGAYKLLTFIQHSFISACCTQVMLYHDLADSEPHVSVKLLHSPGLR